MTVFIDNGEPGTWARALRHRTPASGLMTAATTTGCEGQAAEAPIAAEDHGKVDRVNACQSSGGAVGPPANRPFSLFDFTPFHEGSYGLPR